MHISFTTKPKTKNRLVTTKQRLIHSHNRRKTQRHKTIRQPNQTPAETRLSTTLLDVAQANDLQITKLYPQQGILLGYHPALKRKAILTYSTNYGIKVWYWHDNPEEVTDSASLNQIKQYLLDIAKERGIEIENMDKLHPAN